MTPDDLRNEAMSLRWRYWQPRQDPPIELWSDWEWRGYFTEAGSRVFVRDRKGERRHAGSAES